VAGSRLYELIAVCRDSSAGGEEVVGMALSEVAETSSGDKVGFLRFLAIDPDRRGEQIGSRTFDALKDRLLKHWGCPLIVWEVEPAELSDAANRRYNWYRRLGGRRVLGIDHSIQLPNQPEVPLWVFVISSIEPNLPSIYESVCAALESRVPVSGLLSLEQ
jgi:ribosomal protein S18 acetylase RimI-like enzyme